MSRLLKNARLLRFPHPSPFNVPQSTPHGKGTPCGKVSPHRGPCIQTFLNSLDQQLFERVVTRRSWVLMGSYGPNQRIIMVY
jgi:hypothetical protein